MSKALEKLSAIPALFNLFLGYSNRRAEVSPLSITVLHYSCSLTCACGGTVIDKEALQMWERATKKHPAHLDLIFDAASHFMRIGAFEALEEVSPESVPSSCFD